jgi:hypothetical protein
MKSINRSKYTNRLHGPAIVRPVRFINMQTYTISFFKIKCYFDKREQVVSSSLTTKEDCMSHAQDVKKDVKKKPLKTLKEKRLEKKAKKAGII